MINKKLLIMACFLTAIASSVQAIAITYPSKKTLQKADRILSLTITAAFLAGIGTYEEVLQGTKKLLNDFFKYLTLSAAGSNIVVNALALKYDKTTRAGLKLLLPSAIFGYGVVAEYGDGQPIEVVAIASFTINLIKNGWDIYSLVRPEQSESTQHDQ